MERRKNFKKKRLLKVFVATLYIFILSLVGLSFNGTYAIFNTLSRTPAGEAGTANAKEILEVSGSFEAGKWLSTGISGLSIKNISPNKLWIYFMIEDSAQENQTGSEKEGPLSQAVQHMNPVCLKAGESYDVPIQPSKVDDLSDSKKVDELGLLGWRNNEQVFTGKIVARVLNNYASYEIGTVTVKGSDLYERLVKVRDGSAQEAADTKEITDIKSVQDILDLIAMKMLLFEENQALKEENAKLTEENNKLIKEKASLEERAGWLERCMDSLRESMGHGGGHSGGGNSSGGGDAGGNGTDNSSPANNDADNGDTGSGDSGSGDAGNVENGDGTDSGDTDSGDNAGNESGSGNEGNADTGTTESSSGDSSSGDNEASSGTDNASSGDTGSSNTSSAASSSDSGGDDGGSGDTQ